MLYATVAFMLYATFAVVLYDTVAVMWYVSDDAEPAGGPDEEVHERVPWPHHAIQQVGGHELLQAGHQRGLRPRGHSEQMLKIIISS